MSEKTHHRGTVEGFSDSPSVAKQSPGQERSRFYEFGPFRLDPAERTLWRGNEIVPLTPKAFDTLHLLVRNSGHLLEKDELLRALWPDTFVEEGSLSNNIFLLRKALGEDPAFIETVPRRGYRFVGAVVQLPHVASRHLEETAVGHAELGSRGSSGRRLPTSVVVSIAALVLAVIAGGAALSWRNSSRLPDRTQWIQLTKFPDSVTEPALSPDGRMLAFIRGYYFGQVYLKMLPDGEPVQLTHDNLLKADPRFSPDGSRIAYTAMDPQRFSWDTWVTPVLGGEPHLFLRNASGLIWTGPQQVLFSEMKSGVHMGIVAAQENRLGARDVYLPVDEPGMAHRSYLSPDGKWVLLVEMDKDHFFLPCRLVPMGGNSQGRSVGPLGGACTLAAWSPDGKWMYFSANPGGVNHIWRQRFPDGRPEQFTSGPTEKEGIAISADGRSLITAVSLQNTSLWIHDAKGERQISLEGNATNPKFLPDGKKLCYLVVKEFPNPFRWKNPGELQIADLESGRSDVVVRDFPVLDYDISADGRRIVLWTTDNEGKSRLWLAAFDRSSPPMQIPNVEGGEPRFGPSGDIFFRHFENVYRVHPDGTGLTRALAYPALLQWNVSPNGKWIVEWAPLPGNGPPAIQAFPLNGGPPVQVGGSFTFLSWSLDGRSVLLGGSYIVPLSAGKTLPPIPAGGFQSEDEIARLPRAQLINADGVVLGPSAGVYAFHKGKVQRNLYRIPIS